MQGSLIIRRAEPSDAASLIHHFRAAFAPHILSCTIWGSPSIQTYVEDQINAESDDGIMFYVLSLDGRIRGAAGARRTDNGILVTAAHVDTDLRKHSCSNRLLSTVVRSQLERGRAADICWDMFKGDRVLEIWYRRWLGAKEDGRQQWYTTPASSATPADSSSWQCINLHESRRQHSRWGFSQLQFRHADGRLATVGNLGRCLRVPDAELAADNDFLSSLQTIGASSFLCVTSRTLPELWTPIATSIRFRAETELFLRRMESHMDKASLASAAS
jgi:hypothetical protein